MWITSTRPISILICDALCVAAALWTLCCHAVVALGGGLLHLVAASGLVVIGFGCAAYRFRDRIFSPSRTAGSASDEILADSNRDRLSWMTRVGIVVLGAGAISAAASLDHLIASWAACTLTLGAAFAWLVRFSPQPSPHPSPYSTSQQEARKGVRYEIALWGIGIGCALVALAFYRTGFDTPFYVSMAVAATDAPSAPMMRDSIHGVDLPIHMPAHRLHSFEAFVGAVSWATGLPALYCYRILIAAISALLTPIALARLFRILTPRHWLWSVAAAVAVLVGVGGAMSWYGNLSIVRISHGKSIYMSVMLPLVYAYGLRFGAQPTLARWLQLGAVQIAALGCTSSALWSAPVAAGLAVACTVRWDRNAWRTLAIASLASAYLVGAGLSILGDLGSVASQVVAEDQVGASLAAAFERVLGGGWLQLAALLASASAWALCRGTAQRFAIIIPLFVFGAILNPYTAEWVQRFMTGPSFWRAMWALPIPLLMALLLSSPMEWFRSRAVGATCSVLAIVSFLTLVPPYSGIGSGNRVQFTGFPSRDVPGIYFPIAKALVNHAPPNSMVVAPQKVAMWVPSFHQHPYVTYSREVYLRQIEIEFGQAEGDLRMLMSERVSARRDIEARVRETERFARRAADPEINRKFRDGLDHFSISALCLNIRAQRVGEVRFMLRDAGFELRESVTHYEIWSRESAARIP